MIKTLIKIAENPFILFVMIITFFYYIYRLINKLKRQKNEH